MVSKLAEEKVPQKKEDSEEWKKRVAKHPEIVAEGNKEKYATKKREYDKDWRNLAGHRCNYQDTAKSKLACGKENGKECDVLMRLERLILENSAPPFEPAGDDKDVISYELEGIMEGIKGMVYVEDQHKCLENPQKRKECDEFLLRAAKRLVELKKLEAECDVYVTDWWWKMKENRGFKDAI